MIRRLQQQGLRESGSPRAIGGERTPAPIAAELMPALEELDVQAYRDGYAEGFKAGEEDGRREAEQFHQQWEEETRARLEQELQALTAEREQLSQLVAGLTEQWRAHDDAAEQLAFELALSSLAHVAGSTQQDGELIRRICAQMAEDYRGKALKLEVSPEDRQHLPERIEGLEVITDHGLSAGQCRVATERGYAETSIADRLSAVYGAMLEALGLERRA
jgi:flagellar biosynthesis/type III secretory pathway protein FliH